MLIYNTTYHCEQACYDEFVEWLRKVYIPTAMAHGAISSPRMSRILGHEENEGVSISLQFSTADFDTLSAWYEACGATLIEELEKNFHQRVAGFSTIMQEIDL